MEQTKNQKARTNIHAMHLKELYKIIIRCLEQTIRQTLSTHTTAIYLKKLNQNKLIS